ncbi:MAG: c-type cytochrome [Pseudomonadota bacterium]
MDAFEINKFVGAVLAALVFAMGLSVLSEIIFHDDVLYDPAYVIQIADADDALVEEEEKETPFAVLLASADPAAGESAARVCGACHGVEADSGNGIGPAIYNIVGRDIAAADGFGYSAALSSHGEGKVWSYDELNGFLTNPQQWVSGTSMGFGGIQDPQDRANVIAYLKSISPDAPPFPDPPVEVAAVDDAAVTDAAPEAEAAPSEAVPAEAVPAEVEAADPLPADPAPAGGDAFAQLVATSDPNAGAAASAICQACHSINAGEPAKLGPNLHGIFNAAIGAADGYAYSDGLNAYAEANGEWDIAALNEFLEAPTEVVAGTRMAFGGIKDEAQRAAIIAWLHAISPDAGPILVAEGDAQ